MARPELGNRHECEACGAKFYDLLRPDPACPKCGHVVDTSGGAKKPAPKKTKPTKPKLEAANEEETVDIDVDASGVFDEDEDDDGVEEVNLSEENAEAMLGQLSANENGDDEVVPGSGAMDDINDDDDFDTDVSYASGDDDESSDDEEESEGD